MESIESLVLLFVVCEILFLPILSIALFASKAKKANDKLNNECPAFEIIEELNQKR